MIETLIGRALAEADVRDPDLGDQHLSAARALRELNRIRRVQLDAGEPTNRAHHPPNPPPLQARALTAIGAHAATWVVDLVPADTERPHAPGPASASPLALVCFVL